MPMLSRIRKKLNPDLKTLNTITISKAAILHNLRTLREIQPKSAFFPVLKSNAYGHGILPLLEILKGQEFPYLAVDSFPEYQLIHKHSRFQILIMGTTFPENYSAFDLKRVAFAISNIQSLKAIAQLKRKVRIHLFIDTGMHREGFQTEDLKSALSFLHQHKQIIVEGVMSHLHSADTDDDTMHQQILIFKNLTSCIEQAGFHPTRRHLGASAGLLKIQDPYFNAFRPGIVLYGYSPFPQPNLDLHPALSLHSTIVALQKVKA